MPALVVRDLAAWLSDRGGHIVAGAKPPGLDRSIEGVSRPRRIIARDIDAFDVHDVVIAPVDAFHGSMEIALDEFIAVIADTQAALIIAGLPDLSDTVAQRAYEAADRSALPLISIPAALDLAELTREILDLIRQRQIRAARYVREMRAALSHARRSDDHLRELATALANETGLTFVLEDEHRVTVLCVSPEESGCDVAQINEALASYAARQAVRPATPGAMGEDIPLQCHLPYGMARAIVPLRAGGNPIAYLSLLGPEERATPVDVDVLWQVAPAFAFELGKMRKQVSDVRRSATEDLAVLLSGAQPDAELTRRALEHGVDLAMPHVLAMALPVMFAGDTTRWAEERLPAIASSAWAMAHEGTLLIVLPVQDATPESLQRIAQRVAADATKVAVGVGRPGTGVAGIRRSLHEAQQAAQVSAHLTGTGITSYADLGVIRLLYPLLAGGTLDEFCHEMLDPVIQADSHQDDSLLKTLDTWFAVNCNMMEAARRLDLHRNTLAYRLNRIQDILNTSLDDPELRLSLQLALKIWHLRRHRQAGGSNRA